MVYARLIGVCFWFAMAMAVAATVGHAQDYRGLYLVPFLGKIEAPKALAALDQPYIDGVYLDLRWKDIEPAPGRYEWGELDRRLALISSHNRKVAIGVTAGAWTPDWVYQNGAQRIETIVPASFSWAFGRPISVVVPWDPVFLKHWTEFVRAFGARYAANPVVTQVKFTGINFFSQETELPTFNSGKLLTKGDKSIRIPDLVALWKSVGYTSAKVESAFLTILRVFRDAFPTQTIVEMTDARGFPPIGPSGETSPAAQRIGVTTLFRIGQQELGSRFAGQYNGIKAHSVNDPSIIDLRNFGRTNPIGFQTSYPVSSNTTDSNQELKPICFMNGGVKPCEMQNVMRDIVDVAWRSGAQYLEIFPADADNPKLKAILEDGNAKLKANAGRRR